jgi:hypothetical protein
MNAQDHARFQSLYQRYLTELTLRGKSDKTIDLYARCLRQISEYFDTCPDQLGTDQLQQYFMYLVEHRSWSLVKIARNAMQSFFQYVLERPWDYVPIVKSPKVQALQDVLSQQEVGELINRTRKLVSIRTSWCKPMALACVRNIIRPCRPFWPVIPRPAVNCAMTVTPVARRKAPIRLAAIAAVRPVSTAPTTNGWTGSGRSCCRWTIIW